MFHNDKTGAEAGIELFDFIKHICCKLGRQTD